MTARTINGGNSLVNNRHNPVLISVIIPTYRDWDALQYCLQALLDQDLNSDCVEVLVINNDVSSDIPSTLPESRSIRYFTESTPGSYAARNRGIRESSGEILAFTDADCLPNSNWLSSAIKYYQEEGAERIAGKVLLTFNGDRTSFSQIYEKAYSFRQSENVKKGVSVTANLFVPRKHFNEVGPFNEGLLSGGDMEWNRRATEYGINIQYAEDCTVRHVARVSYKDLLKKNRRITGGMATMNNGFPAILKCLVPPINKLKTLSRRDDLTFFEKNIAFLMLYILRLHSLVVRLKLKFNFEKPARS
jgi:glycosyltransferase involved in cell wall biosynthesis